MLKFNVKDNCFESVSTTELRTENILEYQNLQQACFESWEILKHEIGLPNAYIVGQEIKPDKNTRDSLDILAFDSDDSSLIVIELKRDKNKLQLLQALSYAAMVANWDGEKLLSVIKNQQSPDKDDLQDQINDSDSSFDVRIVLIAERFDPEVIITANWLSSAYSVSISAFAISLFTSHDLHFLSLEQRFPLKELEELYDTRMSKKTRILYEEGSTWEDVIKTREYDFAQRAVELCQKTTQGDSKRVRFLNVRRDYVLIYTFEFHTPLGGRVSVSNARSGHHLTTETVTYCEHLVTRQSILSSDS